MHTQNTTTHNRLQRLSVGTYLDYDKQFRPDQYRLTITLSPPGTTPYGIVVRRGVVAEIFAELIKAGHGPVEATELVAEMLNTYRFNGLRPYLDTVLARLRRENAPPVMPSPRRSRLWKAAAPQVHGPTVATFFLLLSLAALFVSEYMV